MSLSTDVLINEEDEYGLARARYDVRPIRFIELASAHGWHFKFYGINANYTAGNDIVDRSLLAAAQAVVWDQVQNNPLLSQKSHKVGFAVLHQGRLGNWLLLDWWSHDVLWKQILFRSETIHDPHFTKDPNAVVACTWEVPLIAFERDHWVRSVLQATPETTSAQAIDAYLQAQFNGDL